MMEPPWVVHLVMEESKTKMHFHTDFIVTDAGFLKDKKSLSKLSGDALLANSVAHFNSLLSMWLLWTLFTGSMHRRGRWSTAWSWVFLECFWKQIHACYLCQSEILCCPKSCGGIWSGTVILVTLWLCLHGSLRQIPMSLSYVSLC